MNLKMDTINLNFYIKCDLLGEFKHFLVVVFNFQIVINDHHLDSCDKIK